MTTPETTITVCNAIWLGRVSYREAWALQEQTAKTRGADEIEDRLLLLEHPHTYTLGTSGHEENVLFTPEQMQQRGIEVLKVDRGGDVTYHGPGQLVGYPILKLPAGRDGLHADVIAYVRGLEQMLIATLAEYGIRAYPYPGLTGVWLDGPSGPQKPEKIAAIGVKVTTRRVTLHGFALNVNTDLEYFKGIVPCGISDKAVTSMQTMLGQPIEIMEVARRLTHHFGAAFGRTVNAAF